MSRDKISILCPTRGRSGILACSIRMLLHLAYQPDRVEVILGIDDDDTTDYDKVWKTMGARDGKPVPWRVMKFPRQGYEGLYKMFNVMAAEAQGRWMALWNDDIIMATLGWDLILDERKQHIAIGLTESNHGKSPCTFPMFTRGYFETVGHMSMNTHNDTWLEEVGKGSGIAVDLPLLLLHAYVDDVTAREGKADGKIEKTSASFYAPESRALRAEDIRKLKGAVK